MSSQNLYVETLPPKVMVFGDRDGGRQLGLDEVMRAEPWSDEISFLLRRDTEHSVCLSLCAHKGHASTQGDGGHLQAKGRGLR